MNSDKLYVLHYPDLKIKLLCHGRNGATVRMEGMHDQETRYYISNRDATRREVENFRK